MKLRRYSHSVAAEAPRAHVTLSLFQGTHDSCKFLLVSIEDGTRTDCLALRSSRRSEKCPKSIANDVQHRLADIGVKAVHINRGCLWKSRFYGDLNGSRYDELLNSEIFYTQTEAQILIKA